MSEARVSIKRKRLFYSPEDDLYVLREVVAHNPFQNPNLWTEIKKNVIVYYITSVIKDLCGKDFSDRSLKERVHLLAQRFSEKSENDIYKSGVEDEVSEMDDLLYTLLQLMNEFKTKPKKSSESSHQKGISCREQALTNLTHETLLERDNLQLCANDDVILEEFESNPNKTPTRDGKRNVRGGRGRGGGRGGGVMTPTRTRSSGGLKQSSIRFLEKKNERWFEIRSKELALQEKQLEIEANEKKKRLEIDERRLQMEEKRLEMEEKRLNTELEIFKNQQRLMEVAFLACKKNEKQ